MADQSTEKETKMAQAEQSTEKETEMAQADQSTEKETQMEEPLTEQETKDFQEAFNSFDKNGDGTICTKELGDAFKQVGMTYTDEDMECMMKSLDADGSGTLNFKEFCKVMKTESHVIKARDDFRKMDKDGNGFLSPDELRQGLKKSGWNLPDDLFDQVIKDMDPNKDGKLNFQEFLCQFF